MSKTGGNRDYQTARNARRIIRAAFRSLLLANGPMESMPLQLTARLIVERDLRNQGIPVPSLGILGVVMFDVIEEMGRVHEIEEIRVRNLPVNGDTEKWRYFVTLKQVTEDSHHNPTDS